MYPNISKALRKRKMLIVLVTAAFAIICIARGIYDLLPKYLAAPPSFLAQAEQAALESGEPLSDELREYWAALDASFVEHPISERIPVDPLVYVELAIGIIFLAVCVRYLFFYGIRKSLLAKMITEYTAKDGKEDMDAALKALDTELQNPVHRTKQLILTKNWLYGHVGLTRNPVAFPLSDIVGVYYYHLIRTGSKTRQFFQIIIYDRLDMHYMLQLRGKKQLQELFELVANACPNAMHGNYDDFESFSNMPEEMRKRRIQEILSMNESKVLSD